MAKNTILLADNDEDFIEITVEFLEGCGFEILTATNPFTAHQILLREQEQIQVAVFDSRLMDDFDEHDTSGIDLAKLFTIVPSIILT
jgi:CheY-like chemotaxis protein